MPATEVNKTDAINWMQTCQARGLTDILTPMQDAIATLESDESTALPYVFLLTDGAVENGREICLFLKSEARVKTRIMTLGIGGNCNNYFLMMAAQVGRGFCEIALGSDRIYPQMTHLLEMANVPVLTDVGLDLPGVDQCEIYPFPVPDF